MAIETFRFGIFCEDGVWGAINVDNITYLTTAKDRKELLANIEEVIQLLEGEKTSGIPEDDYSIFCCYWIVEYDTESKKARVVKEVKELE